MDRGPCPPASLAWGDGENAFVKRADNIFTLHRMIKAVQMSKYHGTPEILLNEPHNQNFARKPDNRPNDEGRKGLQSQEGHRY